MSKEKEDYESGNLTNHCFYGNNSNMHATMEGISMNAGYPYGITIHSIPIKNDEEEMPLANITLYGSLAYAKEDFEELVNKRYRQPVMIRILKLNFKKAKDGVWERDNKVILEKRVRIEKKVTPKEKL